MLNSNLHSLFEIEVPEEAPFQNDRLNRQPFAKAIKNLINTFSGGVVVSINGKWGTGKSKFIEMFSKDLWSGEKPYCNTILNVWEHEYFDNPTLAILSSIKEILPAENEDYIEASARFEKVSKYFSLFKKSIPRNFIEFLTKRIVKSSDIQECENLKTQIEESNYLYKNSEIQNYIEEKKSFNIFKESLADYVKYIYEITGNPVIIFIDELDRCNPTFCIEILERIKHLYSVPYLTFILTVDKEQLSNSIRGYFGSDLFNAEEYLRRFINIELTMPPMNASEFLRSCIDKLKLIQEGKIRPDYIDSMCDALDLIMSYHPLSLRQIEKILTILALSFNTLRSDNAPFLISIPLAYIKFIDEAFFNKMYTKKATMDEVLNKVKPIYLTENNQYKEFLLIFLKLYERYCSHNGLFIESKSLKDINGKFKYDSLFSENEVNHANIYTFQWHPSYLFEAMNFYKG